MAAEVGKPDSDLIEPAPAPSAGSNATNGEETTDAGDPVAASVNVPPPAGVPGWGPEVMAHPLFREGYRYDFFQAVRLLQRMGPNQARVGRGGPPRSEAVRFAVHNSLSFPPSTVHEVRRPSSDRPVPVMVQAFLGLTGPSGVLPRHYTERLYRIEREARTPEKHALRDWLDLFNHRLVSLFYRAWEKYRFYIPFERGDEGDEPDPFIQSMLSLIGLGLPPLRGRLRVAVPEATGARELARIDDLVLLHYGGLLAHHPRCASGLEAILQDYFGIAARIEPFVGRWLRLEPPSQTRLGDELGNNQLGTSAVAGDRVWDRQSKFRVRLGPLSYAQFLEFLPDPTPIPERKAFFLLAHLVRLYADPGLDFEVQLVLKADDVPECRLTGPGTLGARLGWNTWLNTRPAPADAEDVVLDGSLALACDPG